MHFGMGGGISPLLIILFYRGKLRSLSRQQSSLLERRHVFVLSKRYIKPMGQIKNGQSRDNIGYKTQNEDKQNKHNTENYTDEQHEPH